MRGICVVCNVISSYDDLYAGYYTVYEAGRLHSIFIYMCSQCLYVEGKRDPMCYNVERKTKCVKNIRVASRKRNERVQLRKKLLFLQKLMQHPKSDVNIMHVFGPMV